MRKNKEKMKIQEACSQEMDVFALNYLKGEKDGVTGSS